MSDEALDAPGYALGFQAKRNAPHCLRCGRPCLRIAIPTREEPTLWVWGCDCPPGARIDGKEA